MKVLNEAGSRTIQNDSCVKYCTSAGGRLKRLSVLWVVSEKMGEHKHQGTSAGGRLKTSVYG